MKRLALLALLVSHAAVAAPPPVGSDDWNIMAPFHEWVTTQHDTHGRWCCDIGDGRPVVAQIGQPTGFGTFTFQDSASADRGMSERDTDHWWVHVTPEHFPAETDRWAEVPEEKIVRGANPTGTPILWLYQGRVQCFSPPDGV